MLLQYIEIPMEVGNIFFEGRYTFFFKERRIF